MTTPPSSPRAEDILIAALDHAPEDREAFLTVACAGDEALLTEVRGLLAAHLAAPTGFLGAADAHLAATIQVRHEPNRATTAAEQPGDRIGSYKLLQQIGEGGFGTVWMAEQDKPVRRRVALKIIKLGMDTREVVARFEQERQALAMMDHPNIARVFDAGATEQGRPFFVMELVRGVKITDYRDEQGLSNEERIELFIQVCQAVQHAHQKGIIHRDLKPSNILVTVNDGKAVPKVIDFGVAKATQGRLTDGTLFTQFEQMIGTPLYMSPEQAEMTSLDVDTRSDIYSLGVLLYELLTGSTPIDMSTMAKAGMGEIRRLIREADPPRPSQRLKTLDGNELTAAAKRRHTDAARLPGALRGDVDWIVMKCLEKDRQRRYDTANGLALDLQRHLKNEVITVRPPTTAYLLGKLVRRNKAAFAASAFVLLALILGMIGTSIGLIRAEKQRLIAEEARELAEHRFLSARRFVDDVFQKFEPEFSNLIGASKARETLARISLTFVESLGDPQQADESFQTDLAELYMRLADALGDPFSENSLGDYEAALHYAKQSLVLWQELSRKDPPDFRRRSRIGILERRVANILWELGRQEEAKPFYQSSLSRMEADATAHPDPDMAARNLAIAHWNTGNALRLEGHLKQALEEHFLPYNKMWLERPVARPEDFDTAHLCCVAHGLVGSTLLELGRTEEALVHLEKAFQWVKIKLEMQPNNARAARDQSEGLRLIGTAQLTLGEIEEGAHSLDESVRHAEALAARDPANGPAQLELIESLLAQAKGFATQAAIEGASSARQMELWQLALQTLSHAQERMNSPELQRNRLPLEEKARRASDMRSNTQRALEKLKTPSAKEAGINP